MQIDRLDEHPGFLDIAVRWLHDEWPGSAPEHETVAMLRGVGGIPPALVAISGGKPVGVLGFKRHELAGEYTLWINAVYVVPESRKAGIGSRLVAGAVDAARAHPEHRLYVYTDVPDFYRHLGWVEHRVLEDSGMIVLKLDC
jgi:GNAT superfamily N-acetyltransferase